MYLGLSIGEGERCICCVPNMVMDRLIKSWSGLKTRLTLSIFIKLGCSLP